MGLEKQSDRIVALHTHTSALESKSKKSVKSKLSSSLCSKKFRKEKPSSKSKQKKPNNQESEAKELIKQSADDVVLSQENDEAKCCDNKLDIKHAPKFSVVKDAGEKDFIGCNKAVNDKKVVIDRVHMAEKKSNLKNLTVLQMILRTINAILKMTSPVTKVLIREASHYQSPKKENQIFVKNHSLSFRRRYNLLHQLVPL